MNRQRVLVTGASGFVGRAFVKRLLERPDLYEVVAVARSGRAVDGPEFRFVAGLELNDGDGWPDVLSGVNVVVHCAARAHVMNDQSLDPLSEFRRVNVDGALNLASAASKAGVKRFVFVSTVKVHGEHTGNRAPFREADLLSPEDPYSISKAEAETALSAFCEKMGLEFVVVRPPLVYGPGVKGNFQSLLKLAASSVPLPFGAVSNRRSMVYVGNLADLMANCVSNPGAVGEAFLVSDGKDLSLAELLSTVRHLLRRRPLLVPVPMFLFRVAGRLTGKTAVVERLIGSLRVDSSKAQTLLGWSPPYSVEDGLRATVEDFLEQ